SDHAQEALSDLVYVEVPRVGATFKAGDAFAVVESVKAASDVYAPIGGTVVEANSALESSPETINKDPYGAGWLVKLRPSNVAEVEHLLDAAAYEKLLQEEEH
ncbi:MAG: glycine cleavage system protein GcvH, partial [Thermoflexales bacterium]|nr:glycine cleavage system protein GcvH [Thermoflexales bacterium]